jgi:hypothetical protein
VELLVIADSLTIAEIRRKAIAFIQKGSHHIVEGASLGEWPSLSTLRFDSKAVKKGLKESSVILRMSLHERNIMMFP